MILKRLNQPLTVKSALTACGAVVVAVGLFFAGRACVQWLDSGPRSPRQLKSDIYKFLKKQTHRSDFDKAPYDFNLKETVTLLQTNLARLRQETSQVQTNLAKTGAEARKLRSDGLTLVEEERSLRQATKTLAGTLSEKQLRLTNRLGELSLVQSNVVRAGTNVAALNDGVTALQNTALGLTNEISALLTNISALAASTAAARTNFAATQTECGAKVKATAAKQKELGALATSLAAKQKRLESKPNDAEAQAALAAGQTNRTTLEGELAQLQGAVTNLSAEATNRLEKFTALQKDLAALQKNLTAKQQDLAAARRQLADKRLDLTTRERSLATAKAGLGTFQTNVMALQTNVVALGQQLSAKETALLAKQKDVAANKDALAAKLKEVTALQEQLAAKQKEVPEQQRALTAKQTELGAQTLQFRKEIGKRVSEASSYEGIYFLIGQQLYVADKLLASKDPVEQQQALSLAVEASQHAAQSAEQLWLAARICEGYLLPNLALADAKGRIGYTPESLLAQTSAAFERADEISNVARTQRLLLERVLTNAPPRADAVRYTLGYALERTEQFDEALRLYREIQDTNYLKYTDQRIPITEAKREEKRTAKK